uniref:uncharacterized protein LOC113474665 isoform X2 n=1 Tax=Ciona intestinalis TaxID=7719 RepID=UPI000EF523FD|nr:uncharacterized protein LOC113474665 isoform X2 [Ciona intestinalis]|eukprot:XP_026692408.1 uncharacterized protein LOC113474665 isoform X2 [Ciona intestinalis]
MSIRSDYTQQHNMKCFCILRLFIVNAVTQFQVLNANTLNDDVTKLHFFNQKKNFSEAQQICFKNNSTLFVNKSGNLQDIITPNNIDSNKTSNITANIPIGMISYWVGATRKANHSVWYWLDGSTVSTMNTAHQYWLNNTFNANSTAHLCASMMWIHANDTNVKVQLNADLCSLHKYFVCQTGNKTDFPQSPTTCNEECWYPLSILFCILLVLLIALLKNSGRLESCSYAHLTKLRSVRLLSHWHKNVQEPVPQHEVPQDLVEDTVNAYEFAINVPQNENAYDFADEVSPAEAQEAPDITITLNDIPQEYTVVSRPKQLDVLYATVK